MDSFSGSVLPSEKIFQVYLFGAAHRCFTSTRAGIAIASEWMFTPEIANGTVKAVLSDWKLPRSNLWAVFPVGRTATAKARTFVNFVEEVLNRRTGGLSSAV